jgi:hypothetical protein
MGNMRMIGLSINGDWTYAWMLWSLAEPKKGFVHDNPGFGGFNLSALLIKPSSNQT